MPFLSLILINCGIIYEATRYSRARRNTSNVVAPLQSTETASSMRKKAEMTRTILFITFLYILLSLPSAIVAGYFYNDIIVLNIGPMIITLVDNIQFSYPAFNFVILYFSNKLFAKEVKLLFSRVQIRSEQSQLGNTSMTGTNRKMTIMSLNKRPIDIKNNNTV